MSVRVVPGVMHCAVIAHTEMARTATHYSTHYMNELVYSRAGKKGQWYTGPGNRAKGILVQSQWYPGGNTRDCGSC